VRRAEMLQGLEDTKNQIHLMISATQSQFLNKFSVILTSELTHTFYYSVLLFFKKYL